MFFGNWAFLFEVMIYVGLGLPLVNLLMGLIGGMGGSSAEGELDVGGETDFELDTDLDADFEVELSPEAELIPADFGLEAHPAELGLDFNSADLAPPEAGAGPGLAKGFPVRFNMYCLCLSLVVMGAMGIFALTNFAGPMRAVMIAAGVVLAVVAYVLLYRLVVFPLKRNDASALKAGNLRFRHAKVTFRILPDSPGKIETKDAVGARISYQAAMDPKLCFAERIEEAEEVVITRVDKENNTCYVTLAQEKLIP